jgi:hypothetical protein
MPDTSLVKLADDLEVLPPDHPVVEVLAVPRPFGGQRLYGRFAAGLTISEILDRCGIPPGAHARVFVEDTLIPPAWWPYVKPKAGRRVTIRVIPAGGGGGGDDSKVWRTVLLVVILLVAIVTTAATYGVLGGVWAAVLGAAITVSGTLLTNFVLFPIPPPSLARLSGSNLSESPTLAITGARNQANLYGAIPRIYGIYRVFPPDGARRP